MELVLERIRLDTERFGLTLAKKRHSNTYTGNDRGLTYLGASSRRQRGTVFLYRSQMLCDNVRNRKSTATNLLLTFTRMVFLQQSAKYY
jgi:hypothetical protein